MHLRSLSQKCSSFCKHKIKLIKISKVLNENVLENHVVCGESSRFLFKRLIMNLASEAGEKL